MVNEQDINATKLTVGGINDSTHMIGIRDIPLERDGFYAGIFKLFG